MNDPLEFTDREKLIINIYKQPDAAFKKQVIRGILFLAASLALVAYYVITNDALAGILGYGLLVFRTIYKWAILKRGLHRVCSIITKYEARLQGK